MLLIQYDTARCYSYNTTRYDVTRTIRHGTVLLVRYDTARKQSTRYRTNTRYGIFLCGTALHSTVGSRKRLAKNVSSSAHTRNEVTVIPPLRKRILFLPALKSQLQSHLYGTTTLYPTQSLLMQVLFFFSPSCLFVVCFLFLLWDFSNAPIFRKRNYKTS